MGAPSTGRARDDSDSDEDQAPEGAREDYDSEYDSEEDKQSDFHTYMLANFGGSSKKTISSWYRDSLGLVSSHSSAEAELKFDLSRGMSSDSERSSFAKHRQEAKVVGRFNKTLKEPMLK